MAAMYTEALPQTESPIGTSGNSVPEDLHACPVASILQHPVCARTLCEDVALLDLARKSDLPCPVCDAVHNS